MAKYFHNQSETGRADTMQVHIPSRMLVESPGRDLATLPLFP